MILLEISASDFQSSDTAEDKLYPSFVMMHRYFLRAANEGKSR